MHILKDIKRVLILRCGALGDLVYSTSVIEALRMEYGEDIIIDFICKPSAATLFLNDSRVRNIFPLKYRRIPILLSKEKYHIINYSKKNPYDLLINLESKGPIFDPLIKAINATHKIGAPFTTPTVNLTSNIQHMVDIIKNIYASAVSESVLQKSFPMLIGTDFKILQPKYALPNNYIVLNPSNSHHKRQRINYRAWPQDHWKIFLNEAPKSITFVIIADKGEANFFEAIRPFPENVIDLIGQTSLSDLVGIISHAHAIVTTDTGPAHIASAVNTPVLTIIGPTPKSTWPYKSPDNIIEIISANLECAPCYNTEIMMQCKNNICMKQITPTELLNRLHKLLHSKGI